MNTIPPRFMSYCADTIPSPSLADMMEVVNHMPADQLRKLTEVQRDDLQDIIARLQQKYGVHAHAVLYPLDYWRMMDAGCPKCKSAAVKNDHLDGISVAVCVSCGYHTPKYEHRAV